MTTKELCFLLADENGTSGDESAILEKLKKILSPFMNIKLTALGTLKATCGEGSLNILLDAHIDRVGLIIRDIDDNGFLLFDKVGGADERIMTGAKVTVYGKKPLCGVICSTPPHLLTPEQEKAGVDITKMAIDIGLNKSDAQSVVSIGSRAVIYSDKIELLDGRLACGAFDDRCGAAAVIMAAYMVRDKIKNTRLTVLLSAGEEVGGFGAKTGAYDVDADFAVAVDVGFGDDPYCDKSETIALGNGPSIGFAPVLDRELTEELINIAKKNNIPYQHDVMSRTTGTNADSIFATKGGIKTALVSIPLRNMHTPVEVIDVDDIENTARLLAQFILQKDASLSGDADTTDCRLDFPELNKNKIEQSPDKGDFGDKLSNLKNLCLIDGTSGRENNIRNYIISRIKGKCDFTVDPLGNIIANKKGRKTPKNRVLLTAHMDEVGFIITYITDGGMLKFAPVGGIDSKVIVGRAVKVGKNRIPGVIGIKPIHLTESSQKCKVPTVDQMYIDIGAKNRESAQQVVSIGDDAYFVSGFDCIGENKIMSKAIDDRFGCATLIDMINSDLEYDAHFAFLVQEEVGLRGAGCAAYSVCPDYAIVLEATTAADVHEVMGADRVCCLGNGAVVSFMDRTTVYNIDLVKSAFAIAEKKKINVQTKTVIAGGNDAGAIHISGSGVKTLTISLPCRYIHSAYSVADIFDMDECRRLVTDVFEEFANA